MPETPTNDPPAVQAEPPSPPVTLVEGRRTWRRALYWYVIVFGPITIVLLWRLARIGRFWEEELISSAFLALAWALFAGSIAWLFEIGKILQTPDLTAPTRLMRCVTLSASTAGLMIGMVYLVGIERRHAFTVVVGRLDPIVDAADRYFKDHGKPPHDTQELVPRYIDHIPTDAPALGFGIDGWAEKDSWTASFHVESTGTFYFNPSLKYDSFDRPASPGSSADLAPRVGRWVIHTLDRW